MLFFCCPRRGEGGDGSGGWRGNTPVIHVQLTRLATTNATQFVDVTDIFEVSKRVFYFFCGVGGGGGGGGGGGSISWRATL